MAPGASTATFPLTALHVTADTPVTVSDTFQGITRSGTVMVLKGLDTVAVTKAEYVVVKNILTVEATSTSSAVTLKIFNTSSGGLICTTTCSTLVTLNNVGGGKFTGQFAAPGPFTSVGVQSSQGGSIIAPVTQK